MGYKFSDENFEAEVEKSSGLVIVDFYADWCGPCKMMGPIVEELAAEYEGSVKIGKLNVDDSPNMSQKYRVMTIPTILYFKDGKVVDTIIGVVSKSALADKIKMHS